METLGLRPFGPGFWAGSSTNPAAAFSWGWGAVIASALFGLTHAFNLGSYATHQWQLTPWWGLWTFAAGFVSAFLREKTGSIVAPTLLHGLPQGIASAFLGV